MRYDVVVAGGSVAGLLCAREIARGGNSVIVLEEDAEIGSPEHCGGLVSTDALAGLGVTPSIRTFGSHIREAVVFSPGRRCLTIPADRQRVAEISRQGLDRQIAEQAHKAGAHIQAGVRVLRMSKDGVESSEGSITSDIVVDARGVSSLAQKDKAGIIPSAQYQVHASWIGDRVEVHLDQKRYPGFFAWVIPSSPGAGKVGVAGRSINVATALNDFLTSRGRCSISRRVFAPVWVGGPLKEFVTGDVVSVGDAAGQTKPTTAGGIYSCGMGGIMAGRAISAFLDTGRREHMDAYQREWMQRFGDEFHRQLLARRILERLDNKTIDLLFGQISSVDISGVARSADFDFHAASLVQILGMRKTAEVAGTILGSEIRRILERMKAPSKV